MSIDQAINVLTIEIEGIQSLINKIDDSFDKMVTLIHQSEGRLIVSGIGKSGLIARKIVATLNSTGTHAFFLHPVEAMHGDLGMVAKQDVFLALSNSGETDELNILIPVIHKIGCKIISFTGNKNSTLAQHSDITIDVGVPREACPLGLAPTASTTAVLALGDALAVVLLNRKNFKKTDFRKFHPGGSLGHRLALKVKDIMIPMENTPIIHQRTPFSEAISTIDQFKLGATLVAQDDGLLLGIFTDGDIRRAITLNVNIRELNIKKLMTMNPRTTTENSQISDALYIMEKHQITVLPVVDHRGKICGIVHLHDILGKGSFKFNNVISK